MSKYPGYRDDAVCILSNAPTAVIYTSGTTGKPKGVMLSHGNLTSNAFASLEILPIGSDDVCLSVLPLSHALERTAGFYVMFGGGATIAYAENFDSIRRDLAEVRPTVMLAVPRLYEKMYAKVLERAFSGGDLKKRVFIWARRTADQWAALRLTGRQLPAGHAPRHGDPDRPIFPTL